MAAKRFNWRRQCAAIMVVGALTAVVLSIFIRPALRQLDRVKFPSDAVPVHAGRYLPARLTIELEGRRHPLAVDVWYPRERGVTPVGVPLAMPTQVQSAESDHWRLMQLGVVDGAAPASSNPRATSLAWRKSRVGEPSPQTTSSDWERHFMMVDGMTCA